MKNVKVNPIDGDVSFDGESGRNETKDAYKRN